VEHGGGGVAAAAAYMPCTRLQQCWCGNWRCHGSNSALLGVPSLQFIVFAIRSLVDCNGSVGGLLDAAGGKLGMLGILVPGGRGCCFLYGLYTVHTVYTVYIQSIRSIRLTYGLYGLHTVHTVYTVDIRSIRSIRLTYGLYGIHTVHTVYTVDIRSIRFTYGPCGLYGLHTVHTVYTVYIRSIRSEKKEQIGDHALPQRGFALGTPEGVEGGWATWQHGTRAAM
jgi:hypothetical protein